MSAPKRWLEEGGGATRSERDLLRLGRSQEPPPEAKAAIWTALLAQIPPIPPGSGGGCAAPGAGGANAAAGAKAASAAGAASGGSAPVAVAVGGGLLKSALIGAGSAIALIATYTVVTPARAPTVAPTPAMLETAAEQNPGVHSAPGASKGASAAPAPAAQSAPEIAGSPAIADSPSAPEAPSAAASAEPRAGSAAPSIGHDSRGSWGSSAASPSPAAPAMNRETRLLEESRRLAEARDALRRGNASGALSRLDELQRAVPGGILGQEREALAIEALAKSGRSAEAQARARAFLQAHPTSPHATRVETFAR
jgi:hypothetical protein